MENESYVMFNNKNRLFSILALYCKYFKHEFLYGKIKMILTQKKSLNVIFVIKERGFK